MERLRRKNRAAAAGFTLVELLVVISIIVLLVGILVPIVQTAIINAEVVRCQARVLGLQAGCQLYRDETGYFPGQLYIDELGPVEQNKTTGCQYLARTLFEGKYAEATPDDLLTVSGLKADNTSSIELEDSISDRFSDPMAVLYYPARLGEAGVAQYKEEHNIEYVRGRCANVEFGNLLKDTRFQSGNRPQNPDGFVIMAAGKDRLYYSGDDVRFPDW